MIAHKFEQSSFDGRKRAGRYPDGARHHPKLAFWNCEKAIWCEQRSDAAKLDLVKVFDEELRGCIQPTKRQRLSSHDAPPTASCTTGWNCSRACAALSRALPDGLSSKFHLTLSRGIPVCWLRSCSWRYRHAMMSMTLAAKARSQINSISESPRTAKAMLSDTDAQRYATHCAAGHHFLARLGEGARSSSYEYRGAPTCTAAYRRLARKQFHLLSHAGAMNHSLPHPGVKIGTGSRRWHGLCSARKTRAQSFTKLRAIQSAHAEPMSRKSDALGALPARTSCASSFTAVTASRSTKDSWTAAKRHGGSISMRFAVRRQNLIGCWPLLLSAE